MPALLAILIAASPGAAELPALLPPGFHRVADASLEETAALAPLAVDGDPPRRLVALYRQDDPVPALFALSLVDAPLALEPTAKTVLASAVSAHLRRELGLTFELGRAAAFAGPNPRVEVWGVAAGAAGRRAIAVAFYPGPRQHLIAFAAFPESSAPALLADISRALASQRSPGESPSWTGRRVLAKVGFWVLAFAALAAAQIWRRRQSKRP